MAAGLKVGKVVAFGYERYIIEGSSKQMEVGVARVADALFAYLRKQESPKTPERTLERKGSDSEELALAKKALDTVLAETGLSYKLVKFSA